MFPDEIGYRSDCLEIEIPPGAYELVDIKNVIQQEFINSCSSSLDSDLKLNIEADTISMKSVLTTSFPFILILNLTPF